MNFPYFLGWSLRETIIYFGGDRDLVGANKNALGEIVNAGELNGGFVNLTLASQREQEGTSINIGLSSLRSQLAA